MKSGLVMASAALFLLMACMAGSFGNDLVIPGQKSVKHEIRFTNLAAFPEFAFELELPAGWNRAPIPITEGEPVSFYKHLEAHLIARPANSLAGDPAGVVARSSMKFQLRTTASESSPVARRLGTFEVLAIKSSLIEVLDQGTLEFDAEGKALSATRRLFRTEGVSLLIVMGLAGLLLTFRNLRRRRSR